MSDLSARLRALNASGDANDTDQLVSAVLAKAVDEGLVDVAYAVTDTPIGPLTVAATDDGLLQVSFGDDERPLELIARTLSPRIARLPARLDTVRREIDEYFEGTRRDFDVAIDWRLSRGFRRSVLERLYADVPYGRTVSYLDLANLAGNPRASRAVGTAMATNPVPIVVPCHRVLRTGGALGGYGGGLPAKEFLLRLEGAML